MFSRFKKKAKAKTPTKSSMEKSAEPAKKKPAFHKILTAEGWRRKMMKRKKK